MLQKFERPIGVFPEYKLTAGFLMDKQIDARVSLKTRLDYLRKPGKCMRTLLSWKKRLAADERRKINAVPCCTPITDKVIEPAPLKTLIHRRSLASIGG
jgi:hypothetical protein